MSIISNKKTLSLFIGISFIVIALLATFIYLKMNAGSEHETEIDYPIVNVFKYGFSVKNPTNEVIDSINVFAYAPFGQNATQILKRLDFSPSDGKIKNDISGQLLHFEIAKLAPYETKIIKVKAEMAFSAQPHKLPSENVESYLGEEHLIETQNSEIVARAKRLKKDTELATIQSIYDFVKNHIDYTGYIEADLGATYALSTKKGDCTEFASLIVALARVNQIPARSVSGFMYASSGVLKPSEYHSWAEVFIDGTWQLVDAQRHNFMSNQEKYLALRVQSDRSDTLRERSMQLAYSDDGVILTMND